MQCATKDPLPTIFSRKTSVKVDKPVNYRDSTLSSARVILDVPSLS